jgi:hypothetical protein
MGCSFLVTAALSYGRRSGSDAAEGLNAGYQLASHLTVNGTQDRLALQLSQKGPVVGMEFSF